MCTGGVAGDYDEMAVKHKLADHEILIRVEIKGGGPGETRFWTCDLTDGYVRINGSYRT